MRRDVRAAAATTYDLIIVGGGIHGAILVAEAARRGLQPLLLERCDFGGATSWSSLRILHGGLRYLQSFDLRRFKTSVVERRWFCRTYPDLIVPLQCIMPLYGRGLKRLGVFRAALSVNDLLSRRRNVGVRSDCHLPESRVLDSRETRSRVPALPPDGLEGAGVWYDAIMKSSVRVLMETLRWACGNGATVLNYVEAQDLELEHGAVAGIRATDRVSKASHLFRAEKVVNCSGPWCRELARGFDGDVPDLFRPSLAFNVLFDRPRLSDHAVAVEPPLPDARVYFIVPWNGKMLAGTRHLSWTGSPGDARPPLSEVDAFIDELNLAVPGLGLGRELVRRVYAGQLPAEALESAEAARTPVVYDHGRNGGPSGLVSVSGVKWTTARDVATRALEVTYGRLPSGVDGVDRPTPLAPDLLSNVGGAAPEPDELLALFRRVTDEEAVVWLDDLLLRRMEGLDSEEAFAAAVDVGLEALRGRGRSVEEHLARLLRALDRSLDRSARAVRARIAPGPTKEQAGARARGSSGSI